MIRGLYSIAMWLAQPLLRRKLQRRGVQEPGYRHAIDERFGHYALEMPAHVGPTVWIHAVSLGETRAAAVLVTALRQQLPTMRLLLTHGTATGRAEGAALLQAGDVQCWQPWDAPAAVQRFLTHFQPAIGILMETEVWPNLVRGCQQQGVPLVLANARLSDKSLRQAKRLAWLSRPAFAGLTAVWAQTQADADRLAQLGAPVRGVLGNLKFDATPDARQQHIGRSWRRQAGKPVVMLASAREGEELLLLQSLKAFMPSYLIDKALPAIDPIVNQVQWLVVPRHPQRFDTVATLIEAQGFAVSRRSAWGDGGPLTVSVGAVGSLAAPATASTVGAAGAALPVVWLGDSLGEMALYYSLADVALLGGSFAPLGGQNLIEAAACGCPVVMGPHTFNFAQACEQAAKAGAALRVADMHHALDAAAGLATNSQELGRKQLACHTFASAHRGAASRLAQAIAQALT